MANGCWLLTAGWLAGVRVTRQINFSKYIFYEIYLPVIRVWQNVLWSHLQVLRWGQWQRQRLKTAAAGGMANIVAPVTIRTWVQQNGENIHFCSWQWRVGLRRARVARVFYENCVSIDKKWGARRWHKIWQLEWNSFELYVPQSIHGNGPGLMKLFSFRQFSLAQRVSTGGPHVSRLSARHSGYSQDIYYFISGVCSTHGQAGCGAIFTATRAL